MVVGWWTCRFLWDVFKVRRSSSRLLPRWYKPGCYFGSLMVGEVWRFSLLYADFHLIPLNGTTSLSSVVPWLPRSRGSCSSCLKSKPPVFCSCLSGEGDQYFLISALLLAHNFRGNWYLQWFHFGGDSSVACHPQHSVSSKSVTTHLSSSSKILLTLLMCCLSLHLFPSELCCSLIISPKGSITQTLQPHCLRLSSGSATC